MPAARPPRPQGVGAVADPVAHYRQLLAVRRRNRRWRVALVVLALVVAGLGAATAVLSLAHRAGGAGRGTGHPPATAQGPPEASAPPTTSSGRPTISALTPDHGTPGDTVTITGSGLVSPDGQVTAYFGTTPAPTACSSATTCSATVPPGGPGQVAVTVTTAAGTSNSLPFTYG